MELSKELGKVEDVYNKVDDTLSEVVNIGIRSQMDRNLAKKLCSEYKRLKNCKALVVPKINKELWNTTTIAKSTKEEDKTYQIAQEYLNQGLIPPVQLMDNILKDKESENTFRLARDAFQLLAYAHHDISNLRRQKLKTVAAEKYRLLCNDTTPHQIAQKYLNQGLIPLVQLMDNILKDKQPENTFRWARDAFQLLAYVHRDLSNLHRQKLKTVVAEKYRPLCNDTTPLTENLLEDELGKQIKTLDEMRKVGNNLHDFVLPPPFLDSAMNVLKALPVRRCSYIIVLRGYRLHPGIVYPKKLKACLSMFVILPDKYSGHILRWGGASFTLQCGLPISLINI